MTAKEYLNEIRDLDDEINDKQAEIDALRSLATSLGAGTESERVQSSPDQDKIGSVISKIVDAEREINSLIDSFVDRRAEANRRIDQLTEVNERKVLRRRYLRKMQWEDICVDMGYSWRRVHYIHSSALKNFESALKCIEVHTTPMI